MEIPVLVEPTSDNRFRATCGGLGLEIEAPTRTEALGQIRELIDRRVAAGAEVVSVPIANDSHPLSSFAGMLEDDPLLQSWKDALAERRTESEDSSE